MTRPLLSILLATALATLGCTRWIPIRPDQLSKLETGRTERIAEVPTLIHPGPYHRRAMLTTTPVIETTRQTLLRPDGRTVNIIGRYDLRLTTTTGATTHFEHPIHIQPDGDTLLIAGAETPQTRFALTAIDHIELSQGAPTTAWIGIALAVTAVALMLVYVD